MTIRALDVLAAGAPWAIMPEMMDVIESVVNRETSPEAVAKELGRPLQNTRSVVMRGNVAIVPVSGPIFPKANLFTEVSGATSIEMLALDYQKALSDPQVKSIVFDASTPGGQVSGINEFANMAKAANKKTIAYVGDVAASAGYWIVSQCDEIVIDATAMVGNIGVVVGYKTSKDDSARELVSSRAPDKRPDLSTKEGQAVIQTQIDAVEDVFLNAVATGRGMTVDAVAAIRGQVLIGQAAVDAGLADKLGSLESVIAGLSGSMSTTGGHMAASDKEGSGKDVPATIEIQALTVSTLKADHPDVYQSVFAEGVASLNLDESQALGATQERERIQAVEAQCMAGHEELIASLKFDGKTTGGEAAVAVLKAENELRSSNLNAVQNREKPLPAVKTPSASSNANAKEMAQQATQMVAEAAGKGITMSVAQAMKKIQNGEAE